VIFADLKPHVERLLRDEMLKALAYPKHRAGPKTTNIGASWHGDTRPSRPVAKSHRTPGIDDKQ
jgi:hypothetical protein